MFLLSAVLCFSVFTGCEAGEPELQVILNGNYYEIDGRASSICRTNWLGEQFIQEVSWENSLGCYILETKEDDTEIILAFSVLPDSLQIEITDSEGRSEVKNISASETCTLTVSTDCSYLITGTWNIGNTRYEMEYARITVRTGKY